MVLDSGSIPDASTKYAVCGCRTRGKSVKGPAPLKEITYLSVKVGGAVKFKEDIMTIEELYDKWENGTEEEKQEVEREILGRLLYYNGD